MKKFQSIKKILWAVDPYQKNETHNKNVASVVSGFAKEWSAKVEIVYVYSMPNIELKPSVLNVYERPFLDDVEKRLHKLKRFMSGVSCSVKVVSHHAQKKHFTAPELLLQYAKTSKASVIALASHARRGVEKLFLGSFAEDVVLHSSIPTLVIGPHMKKRAKRKFSEIMVPVDFSADSRKVFQWSQDYCRQHKNHLNVFHAAVDYFAPLVQPLTMAFGGSYPFDPKTYTQVMNDQRSKLEKWVEQAQKKKIQVAGLFSQKPGPVYEAVCEVAQKKKQDLIIMGTHHGGMTSVITGSVTRQVLRHATVPVLVLRV